MKRKNVNWFRLFLVFLLVILVSLVALFSCMRLSQFLHPSKYIASSSNTLEVKIPYKKHGEIEEEILYIPRGTEVELRESGKNSSTVKYDGREFEINNSYLADSLEECIQVDYVYPRRLVNLRTEKAGALSDKVVEKGERVEVVSVSSEDLNTETGEIKWYQVQKGKKTYWLSGYYVETSKELAEKKYGESVTYSTYWDDYFGDGYSQDAYIDQVDYKPFLQDIDYGDNQMISNCNSVHVNLDYLVKYPDYYLSLKDTTGINSICVEVKGDGGYIWYDSEVPENYMKDTSAVLGSTVATKKEMAKLFKKFQDAGFYVIARIVTFKDGMFAENNLDDALTNKDGTLYYHNEEYWPSAYSRNAWMYNVDIAKEVAQCNVNEIQFDYVRFPDGTCYDAIDETIDFKNTYNESKVAALQGFLMYAKEELVPYQVYLSADLFAWPVVAEDDQDIGQFLCADAIVLDAVSPMPYTDHFSQGSMGIADPTTEPEETLYQFSTRVKRQMSKITTNCLYRTWIQGYGDFTADDVKAEINGINRAGYEGYIVWFGNGSPDSLDINYTGYIDSSLEKEEDTED